MGISEGAISQFKTRRLFPADDTMVKLAELACVDPYIALLDLNMWRSQGDAQKAYSEILKKIMGVIALVMFLGLAAPSNALASAGGMASNISVSGYIHYHIIAMYFLKPP